MRRCSPLRIRFVSSSSFYRPQGKVMFSGASVCSQWGRETSGRWPPFWRKTPLDRDPLTPQEGVVPLNRDPSVQTSSAGHCSGRCASYWNAFLFSKMFGIHDYFLWGYWYPCFELLVTCELGFKGRADPSHVCFLFLCPIHKSHFCPFSFCSPVLNFLSSFVYQSPVWK